MRKRRACYGAALTGIVVSTVFSNVTSLRADAPGLSKVVDELNSIASSEVLPEKTPEKRPVHGEEPQLSHKEREGVKLSQKWARSPDLPVAGEHGKVVYIYGATMPSVVCSPLLVCDIELQEGEKIIGVPHIGDKERWNVEPITSGTEEAPIPHIVVKPQYPGLETSLIVPTDRRTYYMRLVSSKENYMARVAFTYPDASDRKWVSFVNQQRQQVEIERQKKAVPPPTPVSIEMIDFGYEIEGNAPWKPLRVYNNGVKTIVELPDVLSETDTPVLLALGPNDKEQQVNYRIKGNKIKVDGVFSKAVLVAGVGDSQMRVVIRRSRV